MVHGHVHPIHEDWTAHVGGQEELVEAVRTRLRVLAAVVSLGSLLYLGLGLTAWANGPGMGVGATEPAAELTAIRASTTLLSVAMAKDRRGCGDMAGESSIQFSPSHAQVSPIARSSSGVKVSPISVPPNISTCCRTGSQAMPQERRAGGLLTG